jgi:hypothetical protein
MPATGAPMDDELRSICADIVGRTWSDAEWAAHESDDMFQTPRYCGGYDADEGAFCFSRYDADGSEWWFQMTLADVARVAEGQVITLRLRKPE